jgi:hypothetical protein
VVSMLASLVVLEKIKSPWARVFAMVLVGAAPGASRKLVFGGRSR